MDTTLVVKIGGSVLETAQSLARVADMICEERQKGSKLLVVVSALKGTTRSLLDDARMANPAISGKELDSIIGLGEVTAARLLSQALVSKGVKSMSIDPSSPLWPIITDDTFGDANPLIEECEEKVEDLKPLMEDAVLVVCGFLGKTKDGSMTTLGAGGSDTTAVVLARCLGSREVILVKDVDGVYSGDPKEVEMPVKVGELSADDMLWLAESGARVLHTKALRYLTGDLRLRIATPGEGGISRGGSTILGVIPGVAVEMDEEPLSMITVVRDSKNSKEVGSVTSAIRNAGGEVISASSLGRAVIVYARGPYREMLREIHEEVVRKGSGVAIAGTRRTAMMSIRGRGLEEKPGVLYNLVKPLAEGGVNIVGLQTVHSHIAVFVEWDERDKAFEVLGEVGRRWSGRE